MNSIKGKIINYNESFNGEIIFSNKIEKIHKEDKVEDNVIILPGYIDLHCHGGGGFDTMQGYDSIKKMSHFHLINGTTTLLPTTWTSKFDHIKKALHGFNKLVEDTTNNIEGIHLEGPFINPNKLGAQPALTQLPSNEFIENILEIANIKVITLAPEVEGMNEFIKFLISKKIQVQFGHTLADFKTSNEYLSKYPIGFTHLYNAMSGHNSRESGVLSSALLNGKYAEIICDKNHVSQEAIKIAHKCIPGLYAVSDAISATGLTDGIYNFAGVAVEKKNNKVFLQDSNTLAGSAITMHETFRNLIDMNFSFEEAVRMTSYNASKYLKLDNLGVLEKNNLSNFIVIDKNLNLLKIFLNGELVSE